MFRSIVGRAVLGLVLSAATASAADVRWVDAWGAAADEPGPSFGKQTLRQVVRTSIAGSSVRVRLSNLFGTQPVTFGPVRVAAHAGGGSIRPGTDRALTFGGQPSVTIAPGADALSDAVPFDVAALQELAVSLYVPSRDRPVDQPHGRHADRVRRPRRRDVRDGARRRRARRHALLPDGRRGRGGARTRARSWSWATP